GTGKNEPNRTNGSESYPQHTNSRNFVTQKNARQNQDQYRICRHNNRSVDGRGKIQPVEKHQLIGGHTEETTQEQSSDILPVDALKFCDQHQQKEKNGCSGYAQQNKTTRWNEIGHKPLGHHIIYTVNKVYK